jgi:hypothetical protein
LFVLTTLVFPKGIVGLLRGLRLRRAPPPEEAPAGAEERA